MRFLHIADLHIGKRLSEVSMLEDQQFILKQLIALAESESVDAVLIAGDVYQRSSPQSEAMSLFNDFVTALAAAGRQIFVISGNHDDSRRISYFSALLRRSGVYVSEGFDGSLQRVTLSDEHGEIDVHLLPFVKPVQVRRALEDESIQTSGDAVAAIVEKSVVDRSKRNVLLCHQFIVGGESSQSEELNVGGLDGIEASLFEDFDYVALGHLHKPQQLGRDTLRYAGSPLKYSFSEIDHEKSAAIVDMGMKGDVSVRLVPLRPLRELREARGSLAELMAAPYSEDYMRLTVTDELVPPDARVSLSTVFPNMLRFAVHNSKTCEEAEVSGADSIENKSVEELFTDFYTLQNNGQPPGEAQLELLRELLSEEAQYETAEA